MQFIGWLTLHAGPYAYLRGFCIESLSVKDKVRLMQFIVLIYTVIVLHI